MALVWKVFPHESTQADGGKKNNNLSIHFHTIFSLHYTTKKRKEKKKHAVYAYFLFIFLIKR